MNSLSFASSSVSSSFHDDNQDDVFLSNIKINDFSNEHRFSEFSLIDQIKEKNDSIDVIPIEIIDNKDNIFPISKLSLLVNFFVSAFYSTYQYEMKDYEMIYNLIFSAIRCGNIQFFQFITKKKSEELRNGYTEIISRSYDSINRDIVDENDSIFELFKFDDTLIKSKIDDILNFSDDTNLEIQLKDIFNLFKENGKTMYSDIKSFPISIDFNTQIRKKITILCGIFRNNESEISKLKSILIHIENNDRFYADSLLLNLRSIPKSVWHFIYSLDISFLINMLIWTESSFNDNPHNIIVKSKPLLEYLKKCLTKNSPKEEYINQKLTPNVVNLSEKEREIFERNRVNLHSSLNDLIDIIENVKDITDCESCSRNIHCILNGKNDIKVKPKTQKTKSFDDECLITRNLIFMKRKIHNLNKNTQKKTIHGYSKECAAVAPTFKQILSLIGTLSNLSLMNHQNKLIHPSIKQIINLNSLDFTFALNDDNSFLQKYSAYSETRYMTVLPLNLYDIFENDLFKSYILFFDNNIKNKINVCVNKIFLKKEKKMIYQIIDFYLKDENNLESVGVCIYCNTIKDLVDYFVNSPIYNNYKIECKIYILNFEESYRNEIMLYLNNLIV